MADIEYSENYAIYLTKNGIRFLTNEISIRIMDLLLTKSMTATDISRELGISKSSVQSNMNKLSRIGYVTYYNDNSDGRKVFYVPASAKLISNGEPISNLEGVEDRIIGKLVNKEDMYKGILDLTNLMSLKFGVDIRPLIFRLGSLIAYYQLRNKGELTLDQAIEEMNKLYNSIFDIECEINLTDEDVQVKVHLGLEYISFAPINDIIAGSVCKIMTMYRKKPYVVKSILDAGNDTTVISFAKYDGNMKIGTGVNILNDEVTKINSKNAKLYSIYAVNGRSILFGNDTQISILDALGSGDMTLKELSEKLDILPVTIHVNMSKLMAIKAVMAKGDTKMKNTSYSLTAQPIVTAEKVESSAAKEVANLFETVDLYEDPFRVILGYISWTFRATGVGLRSIMDYLGSEIANRVMKKYPEDTAEQAIDRFTKIVVFRMGMTCETKIPLVFTTSDDHTLSDLKYLTPFFAGFAQTALKTLTGHDYPVTFKNANGSVFYPER